MNDLMFNDLPTSGTASLIYMAVATLVAIYLARKTEYFWFSLVLLLWLLGQPILHAYYIVELGPFDLQPNRMLLLFLMIALPYVYQSNIGYLAAVANERRAPSYETYLVILLGLVVLAMVLNWNMLPPKKLVAIPLEILTFLLLYHFSKRIITIRLLNAILTTLVIMAIGNAVIAFIQIVDPLFLRTAPLRHAFGDLSRAFGAFSSEYVLGAFQIVAIFVLVTHFKKSKIKFLFIPLIVGSIVLTFHRLDLIILLLCGILFFSKYASKNVSLIGNFALVVALLAAVPAYVVLTGGQSQFVDERLSENTLTGRFTQFGVVISLLPKHPLGLGSDANPIYQNTMIDAGIYRATTLPTGQRLKAAMPVHNGYLGIGMKYGIAAMIVFTMMMWKMAYYFYSRSRKDPPITIIPFFAVIVWAMSNVSNGIIEFRSYNVMALAMIIGAFAGAYRKGLLESLRK